MECSVKCFEKVNMELNIPIKKTPMHDFRLTFTASLVKIFTSVLLCTKSELDFRDYPQDCIFTIGPGINLN